MVLLCLLHQKGFFDHVYDWWDDHFHDESDINHGYDDNYHHMHHRDKEMGHHRHVSHKKRSREHRHLKEDPDYYYYLHHVHKDKFKHRHGKHLGLQNKVLEDEHGKHHRKDRSSKGHVGKKRHHHRRHTRSLDDEQGLLLQYKRRE